MSHKYYKKFKVIFELLVNYIPSTGEQAWLQNEILELIAMCCQKPTQRSVPPNRTTFRETDSTELANCFTATLRALRSE